MSLVMSLCVMASCVLSLLLSSYMYVLGVGNYVCSNLVMYVVCLCLCMQLFR